MFKSLYFINGKKEHPRNGTFVYQDTEFECEFIPNNNENYMKQIISFIITSYEKRNLSVVDNLLSFLQYNDTHAFISNYEMLAYIKHYYPKYYDGLAKVAMIL